MTTGAALVKTASLGAFAAAWAAITPGPAVAEGDTYQLDPAHTHVVLSVQRFGFNDVIAFFPGVTGAVMLNEAAPEESSVEAEIDVASIMSGDATRNEHLTGAFWLNAEEFPKMSFKSTAVVLEGEMNAAVTGDLTLLGKTLPITLEVTLNKLGPDPATKRQAAGFSAKAKLKRSEFGLTTAGALVGDDVSIRIETLAHKAE